MEGGSGGPRDVLFITLILGQQETGTAILLGVFYYITKEPVP